MSAGSRTSRSGDGEYERGNPHVPCVQGRVQHDQRHDKSVFVIEPPRPTTTRIRCGLSSDDEQQQGRAPRTATHRLLAGGSNDGAAVHAWCTPRACRRLVIGQDRRIRTTTIRRVNPAHRRRPFRRRRGPTAEPNNRGRGVRPAPSARSSSVDRRRMRSSVTICAAGGTGRRRAGTAHEHEHKPPRSGNNRG